MPYFVVWSFNAERYTVMSERQIAQDASVELASGAYDTSEEASQALNERLRAETAVDQKGGPESGE